jgi:platelet-activating factor acetylhydrolase IB subunit beta/gamma
MYALILLCLLPVLSAVEYPYAPYREGSMDPQVSGWPLTQAEETYVLSPEYGRKPGHEAQKHLPDMWPVTPTAAHWGSKDPHNRRYLDLHAKVVARVQQPGARPDLLLLGDSITQHWGDDVVDQAPWRAAWKTHFSQRSAINAGIGGDRIENVLWRIEHGLFTGTSPRVVVLLVGVNNTPLIASGVPPQAVAEGIRLATLRIRELSPESQVVVVQILPFGKPQDANSGHARTINQALVAMRLDQDPQIHVVDAAPAMLAEDGTMKPGILAPDNLHLAEGGYAAYAEQLRPLVDSLLDAPAPR